MVESPQDVYVHDSEIIQDDGEEVWEVTLNTNQHTPAGARAELYEEVYNAGVDPALLHDRVNDTIGRVWFNDDGSVSHVELNDWVLEEYGN